MLSKSGIHMIKALSVLSRLPQGTFSGAADIAREIGAPPNYLGKLLQSLARKGIIISQKGLGGGFKMANRTEKLSLMEAISPVEPVDRWSGCFMSRLRCAHKTKCPAHEKWSKVRDAYLTFLKETTVDELAV
jgi:Rrf2 family protein